MSSASSQAPDSKSPGFRLTWDRACDILGASPLSAIYQPPLEGESRFLSGRQFLFQDDPAQLPLESLWLKLSAFACLCRSLVEFYQQHRRPYLSLDPAHVTVRASNHSFTWLPARWLLSVALDEPKAATPLVHEEMPKEMAQHIFTPSDQLDPAYTAPVTRQWPLARELPVTLLIRSMERIPGDREDQLSQGLIRAHLFSDSVSFADFSERDVLHVVIGVPGTDTVRAALWASGRDGLM
jgi:hypothetical protein